MNINKIFNTKTIAYISFSKYTIKLQFNEKLTIIICDFFNLEKNGEIISSWYFDKPSKNLEELINIIEMPIKNVSFFEELGMSIEFDNYKLVIPKPDDDYEYLHIMSDEEGIYIY